MKEPAIVVENISKIYRLKSKRDLFFDFFKKKQSAIPTSIVALENISFVLNEGDILGIIGGNGAGKSTLLKILAQVIVPSSGKVILRGRISSLLEIGTGFHSDLSGIDNLFINGILLGMTKKEVKARLNDIIEFSGIGDFIHLPVKRYSSGMVMRLAFSIAVHLNSEILLLDEVFAVGDIDFQKKALAKIEELFKQGRTIIYVSHDLESIRQFCNQCLFLKKGRVVSIGPVEDVISSYLKELNDVFPVDVAFEPTTDEASLLGIKFITDKNVALFKSEEKIEISLSFLSSEKEVGLDLTMSLFSNSQKILTLFASDQIEWKVNYAGINEVRFALPKDLLNQGTYCISVSLHQKNMIVLDTKKEAIFFKVITNHKKFDKYPVKSTGIINIQ